MKNKILIIIFVIILIIGGYFIMKNINETKNEENISGNNQNKENENVFENNDDTSTSKSLVLYFSATGTTKQIAEFIKEETNSDIIEIIPKDKYTSADLSYTNDDCRANIEQNNASSRPLIQNKINIENYDTIYLGYPIWWGDVPKIILTLFDTYNFDGKTIIPFCTSGSSSISGSLNTLKDYNKNVKWIEGKRFSSSTSKGEISSWIKTIEID